MSSRRAPPGRPGHHLASVGLALLAGLLVGAAILLAEPLQHRCGAVLQVSSEPSDARVAEYQKELLSFLWSQRENDRASAASPRQRNWQIFVPGDGSLELTLDAASLGDGVREVQGIANEFISHLQRLDQAALAVPTESESFLQSYIAVLRGRLDDAQKRLDQAMASLPASDPRAEHVALMDRWMEARASFDSARELLREAGSEHTSLTHQGEITHAAISADARQAAVQADVDLQQDLKELETTLTELKLHMLGVWQNSASLLEELKTAAAQGAGRSDERDSAQTSEALRSAYAALDAELGAYRQSVNNFAKNWNAEFAALQSAPLDPQTSPLLDAYQRLRTQLNDFLYSCGNRLAAMRETVQQLSRDPADDARHHLRQSAAARMLAELQAAHHRFEFASGVLDSPAHFRLDSALRIARGLRRRVADRMRLIDERLEQEAVAAARQERTKAITALEEILRESRQASDATVDQLIAVQDHLTASKASSQDFLAAVAEAESANHRLQASRLDLDKAQEDLWGLQHKRAQTGRAAAVELSWCGVLQQNVNLPERLRDAGLGGSVTFLAVLLGQILLAAALWPKAN